MSVPATHSLGWQDYQHAVAELRTTAAEEARSPAPTNLTAAPGRVPTRILDAAGRVSRTPALLWDLPALRDTAAQLRELLGRHGIGLSVAVKACPEPGVLSHLAKSGISCDIASIGELETAHLSGFQCISATGPSFRQDDMERLVAAGVLFDAQSATQARQFAALPGAPAMGLRLRVPLPDALCSPTSHGANSRFGVPIDPPFLDWLGTRPNRLRRLRVHTGESTSDTLLFRTRYALLTARLLGTVTEINLGGGLLSLARDTDGFAEVVRAIGTEIKGADGCRIWVEPGSAILADAAYLVTEVLEARPGARSAVTVDASAWNLAPWARSSFVVLDSPPTPFNGLVYGSSLYEGDYFLPSFRSAPPGPVPEVGARMLVTSFGAYTLSNGRRFAGLPLPKQYLVTDDAMDPIEE